MTTIGDPARAHHRRTKLWTDSDYLVAAAYTLALIAPCPFFWNPPFWVLAFLSMPPCGSTHRRTGTGGAAPIAAGPPRDEPQVANHNRPQDAPAAEAA